MAGRRSKRLVGSVRVNGRREEGSKKRGRELKFSRYFNSNNFSLIVIDYHFDSILIFFIDELFINISMNILWINRNI